MNYIFENISNLYPDALTRIDILIKIFENAGYNKTTKSIVSTNDNQTAIILRLYILSYIAQAISGVEFQSSSDALALIVKIRPVFEAELSDDLDADTFSWVSRIFTKSLQDISTRGSVLPEINKFIADGIPLSVIAQYLYQDGSRFDEILLRNNKKIRHPLFFNGTLEVLSQ